MEQNLKIGTLLGLGLGLLLGAMAGVTASSHLRANGSAHTAPDTLQEHARLREHSVQARTDILALRDYAKNILLQIDSPEKVVEYRKKWDERYALQVARLDEFERYATRNEDKEVVQVLRIELAASNVGFTRAIGLIQEGRIKTPQQAKKAISGWTQSRRL